MSMTANKHLPTLSVARWALPSTDLPSLVLVHSIACTEYSVPIPRVSKLNTASDYMTGN